MKCGHPQTKENTYVKTVKGKDYRYCKLCRQAYDRRRNQPKPFGRCALQEYWTGWDLKDPE